MYVQLETHLVPVQVCVAWEQGCSALELTRVQPLPSLQLRPLPRVQPLPSLQLRPLPRVQPLPSLQLRPLPRVQPLPSLQLLHLPNLKRHTPQEFIPGAATLTATWIFQVCSILPQVHPMSICLTARDEFYQAFPHIILLQAINVGVRRSGYEANVLCLLLLPAGHALRARLAGPKITLRFPRLLVYIFVRLHLSRAQ